MVFTPLTLPLALVIELRALAQTMVAPISDLIQNPVEAATTHKFASGGWASSQGHAGTAFRKGANILGISVPPR
jgi:hypothetical protein